MSKDRTASVSHMKPDVRFNSLLVTKFINCLMWDGKKSVATRIFYYAMDRIKERMPDIDPLEVFNVAVENVKPPVEVRSRRVGGANYQVPMPVKPGRQTIAFHSLVNWCSAWQEWPSDVSIFGR